MRKNVLLFLGLLLFGFHNVMAQTRFQIIHNSADANASPISIWAEAPGFPEQLIQDNVTFRTATPFGTLLALLEGVPININVRAAGATAASPVVASLSTTLMSNTSYIIVANGILPTSTGYSQNPPVFEISILNTARENSLVATNTDVVVHHGVTDAPAVDVYARGVATPVVNNIAYTQFQGYLPLPSTSYVLDITLAGSSTVLLSYEADLSAFQGNAITVLASGFLDPSANNNGAGFGLWVASAAGGPLVPLPLYVPQARVQVIHNSADLAASPVDIWLDDSLAFAGVNFRNATPYFDFTADVDVDITVQVAGALDTIGAPFKQTVNLDDNETYVVVANGIVSATGYIPATTFGLDVFATARETAVNAGDVDVLVYHGSTDAPAVDVYARGIATPVVPNIAYSQFQGYLPLAPDSYILDITAAGNPSVLLSYTADVSALAGNALTILASGFLDPSNNSNGAGFGLWVATAAGGALIELPLYVAPPALARVQVIHNSADLAASPVDIWLDDSLAFAGVNFRNATPYFDFTADVDVDITVQIAGAADTTGAPFRATVNLDENETYVVVANGIVSATGYSPATSFGLDVFAGAREVAVNSADVDVLVYHGSTDAPAVDVYARGIPTPVVPNIAYSDFQGYLPLVPNSYILDITAAGNPSVLLSYTADISTLAGNALTILASGFLDPSVNSNGEGFGLWVATAAGGALIELPIYVDPIAGNARVQIIHNSADAAASPVDVWVDDNKVATALAFRNATPFIDAPAGVAIDVSITAANSTDTVGAVAKFTYTLDDNETYVIVANGIVSATGYSPATPFDLDVYAGAREAAVDPTKTDILVYHGSTDAPSVDITAQGIGTPLISDISYSEFEGYLELVVANYVIGVNPVGNATPLLQYQAPLATLGSAGLSMTVLASGFLDPSVNSNGAGFGLFVALAGGGGLIPLPLVVGVENDEVFANLNVYPNPATNVANVLINLNETSDVNINVFDISGKMIESQSYGNLSTGAHLFNFDVNKYNQGLYFFEVSSGNNRVTKRVSIVK
jgi:hypothetical protein